jgi:hypothetical protein
MLPSTVTERYRPGSVPRVEAAPRIKKPPWGEDDLEQYHRLWRQPGDKSAR